jgi:hypothetical protein
MADKPSASLLLAYLRRLARDPYVLHLEPEDNKLTDQGRSRHGTKGKNCQGCPECNGPVWALKTWSVATLWAQACKQLIKTQHQPMCKTTLILMGKVVP